MGDRNALAKPFRYIKASLESKFNNLSCFYITERLILNISDQIKSSIQILLDLDNVKNTLFRRESIKVYREGHNSLVFYCAFTKKLLLSQIDIIHLRFN